MWTVVYMFVSCDQRQLLVVGSNTVIFEYIVISPCDEHNYYLDLHLLSFLRLNKKFDVVDIIFSYLLRVIYFSLG